MTARYFSELTRPSYLTIKSSIAFYDIRINIYIEAKVLNIEVNLLLISSSSILVNKYVMSKLEYLCRESFRFLIISIKCLESLTRFSVFLRAVVEVLLCNRQSCVIW